MRADVFLFHIGLAKSRSHGAALIKGGVTLDGAPIRKPSEPIPDGTDPSRIEVQNPSRYVSRGGLKLEGALARFSLDVTGMTALDLGASTGGFTDCLLQHGAEKVIAVDVGHGQLDPTLQADRRVRSLEGQNARELTKEDIGTLCDIAVCDLSFISQTLIYPAVRRTVKAGGTFIALIKPQFEAGRAHLGKSGIVRDRKVHISVIEHLFEAATADQLYPVALCPSPIEGGDGNREYLVQYSVGEKKSDTPINIEKTVYES